MIEHDEADEPNDAIKSPDDECTVDVRVESEGHVLVRKSNVARRELTRRAWCGNKRR